MERKTIRKEDISKALDAVSEALITKLREKGDHTFSSTHEILGVISEEHQELINAVTSNDHVEVARECLDLAVAAVYALACIEAGTLDW